MKKPTPTSPLDQPRADLNSDIAPPDKRAPEGDMPGRPNPPKRPDEHRHSPVSNDRDTQKSASKSGKDMQGAPKDNGGKGQHKP